MQLKEFTQIGGLKLAPVIFQELIPGVVDSRVTVIDDKTLPVAVVDLIKMEY